MGGNLRKKLDRAPPYTATYQPGDPEYGQGGGDFFFLLLPQWFGVTRASATAPPCSF